MLSRGFYRKYIGGLKRRMLFYMDTLGHKFGFMGSLGKCAIGIIDEILGFLEIGGF